MPESIKFDQSKIISVEDIIDDRSDDDLPVLMIDQNDALSILRSRSLEHFVRIYIENGTMRYDL